VNSFLLNEVLQEARRNQPKELQYSTGLKACVVMVEKFEHEHKIYSNHRYERGIGPDTLNLPPSHAREFWAKGIIKVFRGGACDVFTIRGLKAYKPWTSGAEEAPRDAHENTWVRVRLTKWTNVINGLADGGRELLGTDFYLQWGYVRTLGGFSLEGENPVMAYGAIEIAVPQSLPARPGE
jgi:hypothetical protein